MQRVAFLTYNSVGSGLSNGWHEGLNGRRAFVLQNTKGEGTLDKGPIGAAKRTEQTGILWSLLQEELPNLDHVVVYVGTRGSESAITLAAKLPASKVTFVGCDCNLPLKEMLVRSAGLGEAQRLLCECGGHWTMRELFDNFLRSGELLPQPATAA